MQNDKDHQSQETSDLLGLGDQGIQEEVNIIEDIRTNSESQMYLEQVLVNPLGEDLRI